MKIQLTSDNHIEWDKDDSWRIENAGSDVLVLAGDICVAEHLARSADSPYYEKAQRYRKFLRACSDSFEQVIYIAGNHEHYRGSIEKTPELLEEMALECNVAFLHDNFVDIGDTRFIGSTLWTDCNRGDPMALMHVNNAMNDFRLIRYMYRRFNTRDMIIQNSRSKNTISNLVKDHDKVCVVSHHAPSYQSVHPKYHNDGLINHGYYSDLDQFILDRPQIKLWCHGHMHDSFDYNIGSTRVVCNPRGYQNENPYYNPNLIMEI